MGAQEKAQLASAYSWSPMTWVWIPSIIVKAGLWMCVPESQEAERDRQISDDFWPANPAETDSVRDGGGQWSLTCTQTFKGWAHVYSSVCITHTFVYTHSCAYMHTRVMILGGKNQWMVSIEEIFLKMTYIQEISLVVTSLLLELGGECGHWLLTPYFAHYIYKILCNKHFSYFYIVSFFKEL